MIKYLPRLAPRFLRVLVPLLITVESGSAQTPATPPLPVASLDARVADLLKQMTAQEKIEQLFYKTDGNARLGIPQFTGSDGPHGIGNKAKGWSCFPVTLAMTATWDPDLIQRVGKAIALEQASRGRHRLAAPVLDLCTIPGTGARRKPSAKIRSSAVASRKDSSAA
jgi:beta-glucosidase-like glycosyl hydrolase